MMFSLLPRLALAYNNVKILGNPSLGVGARLNNFRVVSVRNIMAMPAFKTKSLIETSYRVNQFKPVPSLEVGRWPGRHSQRLYYHYLFSFPWLRKSSICTPDSDYEIVDYNYDPEYSKDEIPTGIIIEGVSPDGVKAHMSLMEKIPEFIVPIIYDVEKKQVSFDKPRCSIVQWYSDRILSFNREEKDWVKYIWSSAFAVMHYIFGILRYSALSGVSVSSGINGQHFLNHMMMNEGGGRFFIPFELTPSVDGRKMDLQITANFIYVVYNMRPLEEMKNLDSVIADHWLDTTPRFVKNLYHFLPTFDPNKHCVRIVFDPPYYWMHDTVLQWVHNCRYYVFDSSVTSDTFDRLMTEMGFSWLDKLPERGTEIRDIFDELGGFATYKKNIDVLKFFKDTLKWDYARTSQQIMSPAGVLVVFDSHFELLWILYRLFGYYFGSYENTTGDRRYSKEYLLNFLGYK